MIFVSRKGTRVVSVSVLASCIGVIILCAFCIYAIRQVRVSRSYRVGAVYGRFPNDDRHLEKWLKVQPGVVSDTVRAERTGNTIHMNFIMSHSLCGSPPIPDLSHACHRLGYGPASNWKDDQPQEGK